MRKNDLAEIKKMDQKILSDRIKKSKEDYNSMVLEKSASKQGFSSGKSSDKLTDLKGLLKKRREVAQMMTVLRQKELLEKLEGVK